MSHSSFVFQRAQMKNMIWCGPGGGSIVPQTKGLQVPFPGQGIYPGCRFNPQLGSVQESNQVDIPLSLSPLSSLKAKEKCPRMKIRKIYMYMISYLITITSMRLITYPWGWENLPFPLLVCIYQQKNPPKETF